MFGGEVVSCVRWSRVAHAFGSDVVLAYRFRGDVMFTRLAVMQGSRGQR